MTVTAHSGAFDTADNTLESIAKILDEKCEIFEIDVSFRPDGTPVIIHKDEPAQNEGVLLDDALEIASKDLSVMINLDLKSTANLPAVDYLLKKHGLFGRVFYTGVFEDWVDNVKPFSQVPYYLNASLEIGEKENEKAILSLCEKINTLGAIGLNTSYENAGPIMVKVFHDNALPVSVWTVNDSEIACEMIKIGVDNITTRRPDTIKKCL